MKKYIKKFLARLGLIHPSLGIKISSETKAAMILKNKPGEVGVLVETGTYKGEMLDMISSKFKKTYSIELDTDLYNAARRHFQDRADIILLQGDSGVEIKKVVAELGEPTLFWLDAHGSGEINHHNSPIIPELKAIFSHSIKSHTILIDDARHFDRSTIKMMRELALRNNYTFSIESGIFILHGR